MTAIFGFDLRLLESDEAQYSEAKGATDRAAERKTKLGKSYRSTEITKIITVDATK
jgi:hypothetical protein